MKVSLVNPRKNTGTRKSKANRRRSSGGRRKKAKSGYQAFAAKRLKQLGGGPAAMKQVGKEWRAKSGKAVANWGTESGAKEGHARRRKGVAGYAKPKGAKYPRKRGSRPKRVQRVLGGTPTKRKTTKRRKTSKKRTKRATANRSRSAYQIFAAKRLKQLGGGPAAMKQVGKEWRAKHGGRASANPRRRRSSRSKARRNVWASGQKTAEDFAAHVRTPYGQKHLETMSTKLHRYIAGGMTPQNAMKKAAADWRSVRGQYGAPARRNPAYAFPTVPKSVTDVRAMFPTWGEVKSQPVQAVTGGIFGAGGAFMVGGLGRTVAQNWNPWLREGMGLLGNIAGTELVAFVDGKVMDYFNWSGSDVHVKAVRLGGYSVAVVSAVTAVIRLATGGTLSGVSGTLKETFDKLVDKAKTVVQAGLSGIVTTHSPYYDLPPYAVEDDVYEVMDDVDWKGYYESPDMYRTVDYERDTMVSGGESESPTMDSTMDYLTRKIQALKEELGLSDADLDARMQNIDPDTPYGMVAPDYDLEAEINMSDLPEFVQ